MRLTTTLSTASALLIALLGVNPVGATESVTAAIEAEVQARGLVELERLAVVLDVAEASRLRQALLTARDLTEVVLAARDVMAASTAPLVIPPVATTPAQLPAGSFVAGSAVRRNGLGPVRTSGAKATSSFAAVARGTWLPSPDSQ